MKNYLPKFRTSDTLVVKKLTENNVEKLELKETYRVLGFAFMIDEYVYSLLSSKNELVFAPERLFRRKLEIPPMEFKYTDSCGDSMIVLSNFQDITNPYMESKTIGAEAICVTMNNESFGLSIKNAEDLIDKLQKIVKFHNEFYDRKGE